MPCGHHRVPVFPPVHIVVADSEFISVGGEIVLFGDDEVPCICASHASAVELWYGVGALDITKFKTALLIVVVVGGFTPSIQIFSQPTVIVVERCPPTDTGDEVPVHELLPIRAF